MTLRQRWNLFKEWVRKRPLEFLTLTFQFVILVTTIEYAKFAKLQWIAASDANRTNREALTTIQRAFIFDSGIDLGGLPNPLPSEFPKTVVTGVITHFENSGTTPATDMINTINVCVRKGNIDDGFSYEDLDSAQTHVKAFVGPNSTFDFAMPIGSKFVTEAGEFKSNLFVWGTIRYLDIFRHPHVTEFCEKYVGFMKTYNTNAVTDYFEQCPRHNCADENCPKRWGYNITIECENVPPSMPTRVPEPRK